MKGMLIALLAGSWMGLSMLISVLGSVSFATRFPGRDVLLLIFIILNAVIAAFNILFVYESLGVYLTKKEGK